MARPDYLTLPNALTLVRLFAVPVFVALLWLHQPHWALLCFAGAMVTDGLDGLAARLLNQRSEVGAVLDPLADKLLMFAALTALAATRQLPAWLWSVVFLRDVFLTAVAWQVRQRHLHVEVTPSRVGKYATAAVSLLVVLTLIDGAAHQASPLLHLYVRLATLLAGLAVGITAVQYFWRFGWLLRRPRKTSTSA